MLVWGFVRWFLRRRTVSTKKRVFDSFYEHIVRSFEVYYQNKRGLCEYFQICENTFLIFEKYISKKVEFFEKSVVSMRIDTSKNNFLV